MSNCTFCMILYGLTSSQSVFDGVANLGIVPLNPVTPGHVILIPRRHVKDAVEDPAVTASVMRDAAYFVEASIKCGEFEAANIITSVGALATQTIYHLHVHVVPRRADDGLCLPWTA